MIDLEELKQFAVFAEEGTLSGAAEKLHISQPTLSRTMRKLEDVFGVKLFVRGKNRIELNETGWKAAERAKNLLAEAEETVRQVREFDRKLHTITVESCAPAPLWYLLPILSGKFPGMAVSSAISEGADILSRVAAGDCEVGVLPEEVSLDGIRCVPFLREELYVCFPKDHALADRKTVTFQMLNGFNCLLRSEIGFWDELSRRKMPASRFLVQSNEFEMEELIRNSSLPCFATNLSIGRGEAVKERITVPISDPKAKVVYCLIYQEKKREYEEAAMKAQALLSQTLL